MCINFTFSFLRFLENKLADYILKSQKSLAIARFFCYHVYIRYRQFLGEWENPLFRFYLNAILENLEEIMSKVKVKDLAESILDEFLKENELELWNTEFVKEGKDWFLRIYIDKPEGSEQKYVDINECELVSRYMSDKLDELDPIEQNYILEVSSPGLDRELFKDEHYKRYAGSVVEVKLYKPFEGAKNYEGVLLGLENDILSIEVTPPGKGKEPKRLDIPFEQVSKTKLAVIF